MAVCIEALIAQILAAPHDLALRAVLADALVDAGDPRGELIHLQLAAASATGDDRARLRPEIARLVARLGRPGSELDWQLGFVRAATITKDALANARRLLADPAGRLVEVLSVAVGADERVRLGEIVAARPRPSLLRRLEVGQARDDARWIARVEPRWIDPIAADVATRPFDRISSAEFAATIGADTSEHASELSIEQIAPVIAMWPYQAELVVRAGHVPAVDDAFDEMSERVEALLQRSDVRITFYQQADRTYAGYGNLYYTFAALAPHVEDVRFIVDEREGWIDEYTIIDGALDVVRRDNHASDYWSRRVADDPDDGELRAYVIRAFLASASGTLSNLDRETGAQRTVIAERIARTLDVVAAIEPESPELWRDRARLARAVGDHAASDRAFARSAELAQLPGLAFDRALVAIAARDDAAVRTHVERAVAEEPDRSAVRVVAAFVADDPEPHLRALLAIVDARRAVITTLEEAQQPLVWTRLEPADEDLVRTGRHAEILARFIEVVTPLAEREPSLRAAAAAYVLGWAEVSRIHVAHGRHKRDAARLARVLYAAAAALDPLAGSVHYFWSLFDKRRSPRLLEQALAAGPDHLCTLGQLGAAAREAGDFDRAIDLLDRYVTRFRALHTGGVWGLFWDYHLAELAIAHYENACVALYGVRPGKQRRAGRPTPEAVDRAEAKLAGALALYDSLSSSQQRAGGGVFHCQSQIHTYRGDHVAALEWADRALATDDNSAYFWSTKGSCLNNLGRLDEVIACCDKALALDSKHWHAHYVIACVLAKRGGDRKKIYSHLRRVVAIWPGSRADLASEPDLAVLRDQPTFRTIVATRRRR